jgi:muramoyltetrapeptide carboxypeptidase
VAAAHFIYFFTFLPMKIPPFLQSGDTIGLLALGNTTPFAYVEPAIKILQNWGLDVLLGRTVTETFPDFTQTYSARVQDFQAFLDNPNIKAIFSVRGGYGSYHLLDEVNFKYFKRHPKWIVGFSDITAVHTHLSSLGVASLHAVMPKLFVQANGEVALETLRKALFGELTNYQVPAHPLNRLGEGSGTLLGGNLAVLASMLGSRSWPKMSGALLFIEDVDEHIYRLDRLLMQLKRAGILRQLNGLILGSFSYSHPELAEVGTTFGRGVEEMMLDAVAPYNYPVSVGFPVGHEANNWALYHGAKAQFRVTDSGTFLEF